MANITIPSLPAGAPATSDLIVVSQGGVVRSVTTAQQITLFGQNVFSSLSTDPAPDPAADYFLTWDTSAGDAKRALMSLLQASSTAIGLVELATTAETLTGSDATRAVTPAGIAGNATTSGSKGYIKYPGGIIVNFGKTTTSSGGAVSDTFLQAFGSTVYCVMGSVMSGISPLHITVQFGSVTTTGFQVVAANPTLISTSVGWIAIGI